MKARVPKGLGSPNNMQNMLQQAQRMQQEITKKQEEIDVMEFSSTAGGGAVEVVVMGNKQLKSITIKPEIVDPSDIEMLQDLVLAAVNEGIRKAEEVSNEELEKITGGITMPGVM